MEYYVIEEIIDIDFSKDYTTIKFKLEIDCIDEYRILETVDYHDWCLEDNQNTNSYGEIEYENGREEIDLFNWAETYKDNDYLMDFIYEFCPNISDLPEIFTE